MDEQTVKKLVSNFNQQELIELICNLVDCNNEAEEQLLTFCQKAKPEQNKMLILEEQLRNVWINAYDIIDDFNHYGYSRDYEAIDVYSELHQMEELLQEGTYSREFCKKLFDEIMELIQLDTDYFTEELIKIAAKLCQTKAEITYLADCLTQIDNFFCKKMAVKLYKENGDTDKYVATLQRNLEYSSDYAQLATHYQQEGKKREAVTIAWEGLNKSPNGLGDLYDFLFSYYQKQADEASLFELYQFAVTTEKDMDVMVEKMYHYHKEKKETVKQKEMLIKLMLCTNEVKKWYERCKKELTKEEFAQYDSQFVEVIKKENCAYYLDCCIENKQFDNVLSELRNHEHSYASYDNIDTNHRYSKQLLAKYPQEILELYWDEVNYYANQKNRKNYALAVELLKEIRKTMEELGIDNQWKEKYYEFIFIHKRKRLLMDLVNQWTLFLNS